MSNVTRKTISLCLLAVLVAAGVFWLGTRSGVDTAVRQHAACHESYTHVNTEAACDMTLTIKKTGYAKTQGDIARYIETEVLAGRLDEAGVYFRDLEAGPVFGVNETADFAPASLLKLPLALVYLLRVEREPLLLAETLSVADPKWNFDVTFAPTRSLDPRIPHTVEDLLMHMLVYSDNNSYGVLQTHLYESGRAQMIKDIFLELGFIDPKDVTDEVLSVRRYGATFRGLYNVSLLSPEYSEKVLAWLAASDFTQGLRGGVPESVEIAHKFGERIAESGAKQLHDCGIVYYPENPYLLCIMTRGKDMDHLAATIRHISEVVYQEVDSRRIE